jgi:sporulation protein YlmC with PRC-barrel domain
MALTQTEVSKLYVAIFNRASEGAGNKYWQDKGTMTEVANGMLATPDAAAYFGTSLDTNQAFIEHIYKNTLNKTVADDADGIAYWVGLLDSGMTRGEVVAGLVDAADDPANAGDAQDQFNNRVEVSNYTADTVEDAPTDYGTKLGFSGDLTVTHDSATITTAKSVVDKLAPTSLELTTGTDTLNGSESSDTFSAEVLTVNDGDILDGKGGADTLNIETASNITDKFTSSSIETVNLSVLGSFSVDMKNITDVTTLNSNEAAGSVTINNIADATMTVGIKGSATNSVDLNYATGALTGTSDTLSVTINGANATAITADSGFEAVTLDVTAKSDLATLTASGATDLTISGSGELSVADSVIDSFSNYTITNTTKTTLGSVATVKSIDATANTAGIVQATNATATLNNGTSNKKLTMHSDGGIIQTGSGNDIVNVDSSSVFSTNSTIVKLGDGNDNLNISGVSSAGEYVYGEGGNDTIYAGATLTASDLIDGGTGTDTLNFAAGTHALIAKSIENVGVEATTTVNFVTTDTATAISDSGTAAVSFSNLLNGSTYTASKAKAGAVDDVSLNFKSGEVATVNVDLQKGTSGNVATTNAADVTVTLGAASTMAADGIALDAVATKLTVNSTGALNINNIVATGTEKLTTVTVTGDKDTETGNITNDDKLTSVSVNSTGGKAEIGNIDSVANTADVTVTKIEAISSVHEAIIGNIDFSGTETTTTGKIEAITASGVNGGVATAIGTVTADTLGSVTATSTKDAATIGDIFAGVDTADTTDGTITSLKASGYLAASIGDINADKVDSIVVESTDTTTGGDVSVGKLKDGKGGTKATVGTVDISSQKGSATLGDVTADALGNTNITGGTTATLGATTVTNSSGDSVTGNITVTAGSGAATLGAIDVEVAGTITAKSTSGGVVFNDMTFDDTSGVDVVLNGGTGSVKGAGAETIDNTKGDINVTVTAGTTYAAGAKQTINGGTATTTDIDMVIDASAVTGNVGAAGGTNLTVENEAVDSASSMVVKGGKAANFITLDSDGGTVTYYGQTGADTVTLDASGKYTSSTIYLESGADTVTLGKGSDTVNLGSDSDTDTVQFKYTSSNTINYFDIGEDKLSFDGITVTGGGEITATGGTTVNAGTATGLGDDAIYVIADGATSILANGSETIASYTDLSDVAAYLAERYTSTKNDDAGIFVINDLAGKKTYAYLFDEQTDGDSTIQSADLTLIGTITEESTTALVAADIA